VLRELAGGLGIRQEAKEFAAGCIEGGLLGFLRAMGEQRPTVAADEAEDDLFDRPPPQTAVHLQPANDLAAENPDVVTVPAQGRARQIQAQQVA
jgi:hypothetical protein